MKNYFTPKTSSGKWSIGLIISFLVFMAIFFYIANLGERGGDTFFSNPKLAITILLAAISGIFAFFIGIYSIVKKKDFSIFVILSTLAGLFVLYWALAEILFPH